MSIGSSLVVIRPGGAAASQIWTLAVAATIFLAQCGGAEAWTPPGSTPEDARGADSGPEHVGISDSRVRICDGSSGIRLAYRLAPRGRVTDFTGVLTELGYDFLFVDGACHYWIQEPATEDNFRVWRPYREGQLSETQESELYSATSYGDILRLPACQDTGAIGQSMAQLWDGERVHSCQGNLTVEPGWPMREELFRSAVPVNGAMRIEVGAVANVDVPSDAPLYDWPLASTPDTYAISDPQAVGQSKLIEDPAQAWALRALRDRVVADGTTAPGYFYGVIYLNPKGFVAAIRDHLPFTNAGDGLWTPK